METEDYPVEPETTITITPFNSSPQVDKLFAAMSKAQAAMKPAKLNQSVDFKNKSGYRTKYDYADLASLIEAAKEGLSKNELTVIQLTGSSEGAVTVQTILGHSSGQWISSTTTVKPDGQDAKSIGAAYTYARRYGHGAITGQAPGDDTAIEGTNDEGNGDLSNAGNYEKPAPNKADFIKRMKEAKTPQELEQIGSEIHAKDFKGETKRALQDMYRMRTKELDDVPYPEDITDEAFIEISKEAIAGCETIEDFNEVYPKIKEETVCRLMDKTIIKALDNVAAKREKELKGK